MSIDDWPTSSFSSFILSSGLPAKKLAPNKTKGFPIYGGNGVSGYSALPLTREPTLIIGRVGGYCGSVHVTDDASWITDNALWARHIPPDWDLRFLAHYLQWLKLGQRRSMTGQPLITQGTLANIPLRKPPLPEQKRIAQILDTADTAISLCASTIEKLIAVINGVKRTLLADLETGPQSTVGNHFDIRAGITLTPDRVPRENGIPYLRVANVQREYIDLTDISQLHASARERKELALQSRDLLVVEGHANPDEIGRCARVTAQASGMVYQNHLFRLRPENIDSDFAEMWLNSDYARSYWRKMCATSSGLHTINAQMLARLPFPLLSRREQSRIAGTPSKMQQRLDKEVAELKKIHFLKDGLMNDLLSRRVRVSDARASLE